MPANDNPQGCLTAVLKIFGINLRTTAPSNKTLPYRLRDDFLSPAEFSFYCVLKEAVQGEFAICTKVNLGDLFFVPRSKESRSFLNKIDRKHVDFLLCDIATLKPVLGVELDDSSHSRKDRMERDQFVNAVFDAASLVLLRVTAAKTYRVSDIADSIQQKITSQTALKVEVEHHPEKPICPKCETPMVIRTAKKGDQRGQKFWGCSNYPKCREILRP